MDDDVIGRLPTELFIGGSWFPASDGATFEVTDPATGSALTSVAAAGPQDAVAAVGAAADAAAGWRETAPRERGEVLRRSFDAMVRRQEEIAEVIVLESGKSWSDAIAEVAYAAEFLRWFSEEAVRLQGTVQTAPAGDKRIVTVYSPVGVSVLVTPWNFPAAMATRKIGPALAAGCTTVLKPASETPLTALLLAELMTAAGTPPGVVNVVPSRRASTTVGAMLEDPRVRKLSFTGSTEVGQALLSQASAQVLNCSMELGGNAPFIVLADADLDAAVDGAIVAKMRNGGESCIAANRFLVEEPLADDFADRLSERMGALCVGPGMDRNCEVGPLINKSAQAEVAVLVRDSVAAGAKVLTGGSIPDRPGWFYEPTVLGRVDRSDPILDHEIFGPVAPVVAFHGDDEAIMLANRTPLGLAAYVYGSDLKRVLRLADGIEAGVIGLNRGLVSDPAAPFGGMKKSGLGREGGHEGLLAFVETKYIAMPW